MKKILLSIVFVVCAFSFYQFIYLPYVIKVVGDFKITNRDVAARKAILKIVEPSAADEALYQLVNAYRDLQVLRNFGRELSEKKIELLWRSNPKNQMFVQFSGQIYKILNDSSQYNRILLLPMVVSIEAERLAEEVSGSLFAQAVSFAQQHSSASMNIGSLHDSQQNIVKAQYKVTDDGGIWSNSHGEILRLSPNCDFAVIHLKNQIILNRTKRLSTKEHNFQFKDCYVVVKTAYLIAPKNLGLDTLVVQAQSPAEWLAKQRARIQIR